MFFNCRLVCAGSLFCETPNAATEISRDRARATFPKRVSATSPAMRPHRSSVRMKAQPFTIASHAPSVSSFASIPCPDPLMIALSLVTHSRMYAAQFRSSAPSNSLSARSLTAPRSTRRTSLRSMDAALFSCSSKLRRSSTSFPVICPLMCKIRRPSLVTARSILQVIIGLRLRFYSLPFTSQACEARDFAGPTYEGSAYHSQPHSQRM
jgi:hypothetical protein